jgi:hypothetical protein
MTFLSEDLAVKRCWRFDRAIKNKKLAIPTATQIDLRQALRSNVASQSILLKMRDEGLVKFDYSREAMAHRMIR